MNIYKNYVKCIDRPMEIFIPPLSDENFWSESYRIFQFHSYHITKGVYHDHFRKNRTNGCYLASYARTHSYRFRFRWDPGRCDRRIVGMPKYLLAPISHKRTIETISVSKKFIHTQENIACSVFCLDVSLTSSLRAKLLTFQTQGRPFCMAVPAKRSL